MPCVEVYCIRIEVHLKRFGRDFELYKSDITFQDAVNMPLLQIGEITVNLSDNFKETYKSDIPWHEIRGLRNRIAHEYQRLKLEQVWDTLINDIPVLKEFCRACLTRWEMSDILDYEKEAFELYTNKTNTFRQ